jgi:hypothetical protein
MNPSTNHAGSDRLKPAVWITLGFALLMALVAGLQRYFPHPWNLTLIGALGLWGGARLRPWFGLALPLVVWALTDLVLYSVQGLPGFNVFVYAGFLAYGLLGLLLRQTHSAARIGGVCVLGSVQFFLVTNFSVWLAMSLDPAQLPDGRAVVVEQQGAYPQPRYARNLSGLLACYGLGLPFSNPDAPPLGFFGNLLAGDLFFSGLLFGLHVALLSVVLGRRKAALSGSEVHP